MKVVILEDEKAAAENLRYLLADIDPAIAVDRVLDTVSGATDYFLGEHDVELAFFDIHLADGSSFEIFKDVDIKVPVIFTTAYDEYALQAFRVNSIDYLLKPIDEDELSEAIQRFKSSQKHYSVTHDFRQIIEKIGKESRDYKTSFLVQKRDTLIPIEVKDIAYFTIEQGQVWANTFDKKSYAIDDKLEDIETWLNPVQFFRANRQFIVQRRAVESLTVYINGKLILNVQPKSAERIIISKKKAPQIKNWIS